eukprot:TRINITY_DN7073_c0_g1_i1.p1 TRINITY_DN7073_c0_g1~~TRINITY_DN7073_c0_g1_i1.p1  ORF type:complete len:1332 (+),score=371.39 TRINITY_DN7073_c0_g1_i1:147-4142(+)
MAFAAPPKLSPAEAALAEAAARSLPNEPDGVMTKLNAVLAMADSQGQLATLRSQDVSGDCFFCIGSSRYKLQVPRDFSQPPAWVGASGSVSKNAGDGEFYVDSVQTIKDMLSQKVTLPGLLARRRVKIKGSMGTLQRRGQAFESVDMKAVLVSLGSEVFGDVQELLQQLPDTPSAASSRQSFVARDASQSWVANEAVTACMGCQKVFTVVRRKHHCRSCGGVFCAACAPKPPAFLRSTRHLRQCSTCKNGNASAAGMQSALSSSCLPVHCAAGSSALTLASTTADMQSMNTTDRDMLSFVPSTALPVEGRSAETFALQQQAAAAATAAAAQSEEIQRLKGELQNIRETQLYDGSAAWTLQSAFFAICLAVGPLICSVQALAFGFWRTAVLCLLAATFDVGLLVYLALVSESLIRRRLRVFFVAFTIFVRFKSTKFKCRGMNRGSRQYELLWEEAHRFVAFFVQSHFKELRGFWVKLGQYASTRADILPDPYLEWLGKLQDQMPCDPIETIRQVLQEELGKSMASKLALDSNALASASIGQVHRATAKCENGKEKAVVVKVQHVGIDKVMSQDIRSLEIILNVVAWVEPDFDLRPLIEEWKKASKDELDFQIEARNQMRARDALTKSGMDSKILIPQVWPAFTRKRVLVMDFVDGIKISDVRNEMPGIDHIQLVKTIVDAFAFQLHVDGHFNGDPHPGNLMVERETCRAVMLDWGLCKTFTEPKRRAFAKMVFAIDAKDIWTMMESFEEIGFKFKDGEDSHIEPATALEVMRFILRDSSATDMKDVMRQRMEVDEKKFHHDKQMKRKDPMEVFSGEILFFFRTVDCLQGLCASLGAQLPFLSILASHARHALSPMQASGPPLTPHDFLPQAASSSDSPVVKASPLQSKLAMLLREYQRNGMLLGAQVSVVAGSQRQRQRGFFRSFSGDTNEGRVIADVAAGVLCPLDQRPVTQETLFVTHGLGQLALSCMLLQLADDGYISLEDRLASKWRGFGKQQKEAVTVGHVLGRSAGLWHIFPKGLKLHQLTDLDKMLEALQEAELLDAAGTSQAHHYWSFGWLAAGICQHLAGKSLSSCWAKMCRDSLPPSMQDELLLRGPARSDCGLVEPNIAKVGKPPSDGVDISELMAGIVRLEMEVNAKPDDPAWNFFQAFLSCEHLFDPQLYNTKEAKGAEALCGQGVHSTARAMASLVEKCASSSGTLAAKGMQAVCDAAAGKGKKPQQLPAPTLEAPLLEAPAPLPGILQNIFTGSASSSEEACFWHPFGFQSLPAGAAGLRAPESGAFAAWLPCGGRNAAGKGLAVCLLASRLDAEESGLSRAVMDIVAAAAASGEVE